MAIDYKKLILSILQEVSEGNPVPPAKTYGVDDKQYTNLLEAMQDDGLLKGIMFIRGGQGTKPMAALLNNARITVKGIEYVNSNSKLMKTYRGLKELREWLPFY